ncbi:hypothetical protein BJ138DRAFT_607496 [Hygrophoropsis aurantiaca]|uniref:Uncharacterized protein n=1 Tax=Hygrophoropsis aurantiaca TaxID=72124 RepID=A0ACB8A0Z8_9AGAM|nr:hypothetical protein BJ138DRAFT_607496 [Hygrophoropsis aurantiaca]
MSVAMFLLRNLCNQTRLLPTRRLAIIRMDFLFWGIFELAILLLAVMKVFYHDHRSRIFLIMRNDIFYVLCILLISLFNIVIITDISYIYVTSAITLQIAVQSVFTSRLLFSLRQIMQQQRHQVVGSNVRSTEPSSAPSIEMLPVVSALARAPFPGPS